MNCKSLNGVEDLEEEKKRLRVLILSCITSSNVSLVRADPLKKRGGRRKEEEEEKEGEKRRGGEIN